MNSDTLLSEGLDLMLLGMGTVFLFLTLLVLVTWCMSALVMRYPGPEEPDGRTQAAGRERRAIADKRKRVAAVTAAVQFHHRSRHEEEKHD